MSVRLGPPQDPNSPFIRLPSAMLIGRPPKARGLHVTAHPPNAGLPGPKVGLPASDGPCGGFVGLGTSGVNGTIPRDSGHLDLRPSTAHRLAHALRLVAGGQRAGVRVAYEPAAERRDRYARGRGTLVARASMPLITITIEMPATLMLGQQVGVAEVRTDAPSLLRFADALERAADVADGRPLPGGQL